MAVYIIMTIITCAIAFMAQHSGNKTIAISKLNIKLSTLFLSLAAVPLIMVSGLRWETGVDHLNYWYLFTNINYGIPNHSEIGFSLLCKAIWFFTMDMSVMFFICALITIVFTFIAIKQSSSNLFISVFLFITMGYYFYSMNSIRHFMAISLFLFAFKFLKERKLIIYIPIILLAATFHKVAIVALPLYFLLNIKYKAYWYGIFSALLLIFSMLNRQILDFIYRYIFDFYKAIEQNHTGISYVNVGITLALSILSFIYYKKLIAKDSKNIILINSAFFGLMFFALCGWIPEYTRIGQYLTILSLFLVPKIIDCEENIKLNRLYKIGLVVGFTAFMLVILINARVPEIGLVPYKSIFSR